MKEEMQMATIASCRGKGTFRVGARGSLLSVAQTKSAIAFLTRAFPGTRWRFVPVETPGDRDLTTPLERSAPDFFTRDLDDAVRTGVIDCAVHSAKDLPGYSGAGGEMVAEGLDWFWLPVREDPRDCWVVRPGMDLAALKAPRLGISSARRRAFAKAMFPKAKLLPIRGAIDARIQQVIDGKYDAVLMALAGIRRLDPKKLPPVEIRPIPLEELPPPEAQGYLAVTFRAGDVRFLKFRERFAKAVRFVSAGVGDASLCTRAGLNDLCAADVVLYDALMGNLDDFKAVCAAEGRTPLWIPVGKRCGAHAMKQPEITRLICDEARKGRRVVRLKGGDAGLFGRLTEETEALTDLGIPFVVRPGVSALVAATTGTGLLLTRRGEARGFTVMTPRSTGKETPLVMFMAVQVACEESAKLIDAGWVQTTPCAFVFEAAGPGEEIWQGCLADLQKRVPRELKLLMAEGRPGLFIVGQVAAHRWPKLGELAGARVLVTSSEAVQAAACRAIEDRGGRPVRWPLIALRARDGLSVDPAAYEAIVLTSPAAVRIFFTSFAGDRRRLPKFFTCGAGTDAALRRYGVSSDLMPQEDFSAAGLIAEIRRRRVEVKGMKVLRLRSAKAGTEVAKALAGVGAAVDDVVLYDNVRLLPKAPLPKFEAVHFASASSAEAFLAQYGVSALKGKALYVMGEPTRKALPPNLRRRACTLSFV